MKIIGHRGAKGLAPENTLASFAKALQHNVDEIECDVRITKDGIAVLEHDMRLEIPGLNQHLVSGYNYDELLKFRPDLPTLAQGIEYVDRKVVLQLEVKPREPVEPVVDCLLDFLAKGWQASDFIISSTDFKLLKTAHVLAPQIPLSIIDPWSGVRATWRARQLGTKRISMNEHVMWPFFIRSLSRRGYLLCGYTMDDPVRAARWAKHGLHAVITDYPDLFDKTDR